MNSVFQICPSSLSHERFKDVIRVAGVRYSFARLLPVADCLRDAGDGSTLFFTLVIRLIQSVGGRSTLVDGRLWGFVLMLFSGKLGMNLSGAASSLHRFNITLYPYLDLRLKYLLTVVRMSVSYAWLVSRLTIRRWWLSTSLTVNFSQCIFS